MGTLRRVVVTLVAALIALLCSAWPMVRQQ